jgi:hypothetical protein
MREKEEEWETEERDEERTKIKRLIGKIRDLGGNLS